VTRLRAERPVFGSWQGLGFVCSPLGQDQLWGPPSLSSNGDRGFFPLV